MTKLFGEISSALGLEFFKRSKSFSRLPFIERGKGFGDLLLAILEFGLCGRLPFSLGESFCGRLGRLRRLRGLSGITGFFGLRDRLRKRVRALGILGASFREFGFGVLSNGSLLLLERFFNFLRLELF